MKTRILGLILGLALLIPSAALASPIAPNTSTWSAVTPNNPNALSVVPFWAGLSWDCDECGVGYLVHADQKPTLEYLNDGAGGYTSFRFDDQNILPILVKSMTAWTGGLLKTEANGSFSYQTPNGLKSNSLENPEQYVLFRLVGALTTQYFIGVEDIPLSWAANDKDYNDYIVTFTTPNPVPEPSTLLLLGSSIAALGMRRKVVALKTARR